MALVKRSNLPGMATSGAWWQDCTTCQQHMGIILRWREEPLDCEYRDSRRGGTLSLYMDGELVWKEEAVSSAAAAHCRAREARDELFPRRARRA